ncbi:MAG TPA: hypothetical protein VE988_25790, partial [Gemmataceae bacterium]|nr:hypothetical protein [Gemmataceae bacterium]
LIVLTIDGSAQPPKAAAKDNAPPSDLRPEDIIRVLAAPVFRHASGVQCVAASPDGKMIITGTKDGATVWDAASGKKLKMLASGDVRCLAVAGDIVAVGLAEGIIAIVELGTGKTKHAIQYRGAYPRWLALSADASLLACNFVQDIEIWSVATGKQTGALTGHAANVNQAVFHPDGKKLYSVSADGTLRQWNLATKKETKRLALGPEWIAVALALSKDGKSLALAANWQFSDKLADNYNHVRVLNSATWKERFRAHLPGSVAHDLSISADGRHVAAVIQWLSSKDPHVPLWDTLTAKQVLLEPENPSRLQLPANGLVFLPNGKTLASTGEDGCIRLWNVADGKQHASTKGTPGPITALAMSPKGNVVASAGQGGATQLWDAVKGGPLCQLGKHLMDDIVFSPDSRFVVTLGKPDVTNQTAGALLWDVRTGEHKHTFKSVYRCAAFSPDGKTLAGADDQNNVRLWDVAKGTELRLFSGHILRVHALAISNDGATLASASDDGEVRFWQLATGKCLLQFPLSCHHLWFSPDGSLLFVIPHDQDGIGVYETITGRNVLARTTANQNFQPLAGKPIFQPAVGMLAGPYPTRRGSYATAHGGATLVFATMPGRFSTLDMASGKAAGPDIAYGGQFTTAEFSADGRTLALGYADGGLVLCKPPPLPPRKPLPAKMDNAKLTELWQALAEPDAKAAYQARWHLSAAAQQTLTLFRKQLHPQKADAKQVATWIAQLGSKSFKERELALAELEKAGDAAQTALQAALERKPPLEATQRIEWLLGKLYPLSSGATLRTLRAIVVLEAISGEEARGILQDLAGGTPGARVTEAARGALKRLAVR